MKWKCPSCGNEQPAHPNTSRSDMPACSQLNYHTGQPCFGGKPHKFDSAGLRIEPKYCPDQPTTTQQPNTP